MCFCSYFVAFIARFYSLANSNQLSYVGLHLVGLCLVGLHLVGSSLASHSAHLTLKTIILDHALVDCYLNNIVIYRKMIKLESKRAYDSYTYYILFSHILHSLCGCVCHTCFMAYSYILIDGIDLIDLIDFYNFKDLILWNYLSNFNETYKHYKGVFVEFKYQFLSNSKF